MKVKVLLLCAVILVIFGLLQATAGQGQKGRKAERVLQIANGAELFLTVADTEEERRLGLGGRASIRGDEGMLFLFGRSDLYGIWMKGMRFPIDIIWLGKEVLDNEDSKASNEQNADTHAPVNSDEKLVVVDMKENVLPETYPTVFFPKIASPYVLEIAAGASKKKGIGIGSKLTLKK